MTGEWDEAESREPEREKSFCTNGHEMSTGEKFCGRCGSPVVPAERKKVTPAAQEPATLACPNGHPATPGALFCSQCGYSVRRPPRPANGPGLLTTIQRWSRRQRLIVAALIIGSVLFLAQPFDSSSDTSNSSSRDTVIATDLPENECIMDWNSPTNQLSQQQAGNLAVGRNQAYAPTYVSVGFPQTLPIAAS